MKAYVAVAVEKGLISGFEDNTFRGQDTLTRAEAATILNRAFQLGDNNIQMDVNNQSSGNNSDIGYDGFKPEPTKKSDKEDNKTNVEDKNNTQNEDKSENNKTNKDEEKDNVKDEIKENKKGYKIETLSKALLSSDSFDYDYPEKYVTQINDDLYYYDFNNKEFIKLNLLTKDKETKSIDEFNITIDDKEYVINNVYGIFINSNSNDINIYCEVIENNVLNDFLNDEKVIIDYNGYIIQKDVDIDDRAGILGISDDIIYDVNCSNNGYAFSMFDKNNYTYYGSTDGIYKYDYQSYEKIVDVINGYIGFTNNNIYIIPENKSIIAKYDYNGKLVNTIDFNDIEIVDKKKIKNDNLSYKLFISSNEDNFGARTFSDRATNSGNHLESYEVPKELEGCDYLVFGYNNGEFYKALDGSGKARLDFTLEKDACVYIFADTEMPYLTSSGFIPKDYKILSRYMNSVGPEDKYYNITFMGFEESDFAGFMPKNYDIAKSLINVSPIASYKGATNDATYKNYTSGQPQKDEFTITGSGSAFINTSGMALKFCCGKNFDKGSVNINFESLYNDGDEIVVVIAPRPLKPFYDK